MRKWLIGIGVTVLAAALGVGAAYGGSLLIKPQLTQIREIRPVQQREIPGEQRVMPGMGRMDRFFQGPLEQERNAAVSTSDEAVAAARTIAARVSEDIQPARVYEFQNAYVVVFTEKTTGRGAVEVVISRDGGNIGRGLGPMAGWNLKYTQSPKGNSSGQTDNTRSIETARSDAQAYLEKAAPGAALDSGGYAFYGYYTFSYTVIGQPAGLVSVNGLNGNIWAYSGFGQLISEKEVTTS